MKLERILTKINRFICHIYFSPTPISLGRMDIKFLPFKFDSLPHDLEFVAVTLIPGALSLGPRSERGSGLGQETSEKSKTKTPKCMIKGREKRMVGVV